MGRSKAVAAHRRSRHSFPPGHVARSRCRGLGREARHHRNGHNDSGRHTAQRTDGDGRGAGAIPDENDDCRANRDSQRHRDGAGTHSRSFADECWCLILECRSAGLNQSRHRCRVLLDAPMHRQLPQRQRIHRAMRGRGMEPLRRPLRSLLRPRRRSLSPTKPPVVDVSMPAAGTGVEKYSAATAVTRPSPEGLCPWCTNSSARLQNWSPPSRKDERRHQPPTAPGTPASAADGRAATVPACRPA
jgi:hypothetical protein